MCRQHNSGGMEIAMIYLSTSGLPLFMDEESFVISMGEGLVFDGYSRKPVMKMRGLLADESGLLVDESLAAGETGLLADETLPAGETGLLASAEPFYDVYRGIVYPEDQALFQRFDYRYDITVIMPGQINGECKKTSGHYHGWTAGKTNTYAEVYEVLQGTALYVLQKSPDFDREDPSDLTIEDIILVTVPAGQTLLVPPGYGHCSVNIGEGPLVFSNLAYVPCPLHYDPVKYYHGMSWYAFRDQSGISLKRNMHYGCLPAPRYATVREKPELGIAWDCPVYQSFKNNPEAFSFLGNPDPYVDVIMDALAYHDRLPDFDSIA